MTRESWHSGTYSHEWGTSGIVGVVWGIFGIHQTAPGWANFTMRPKLGGLQHANITVPTLTGYISASSDSHTPHQTPTRLEVNVPCNSVAKLCLPRSASDTAQRIANANGLASTEQMQATPLQTELWLDGAKVESVVDGGHLCTHNSVAVQRTKNQNGNSTITAANCLGRDREKRRRVGGRGGEEVEAGR